MCVELQVLTRATGTLSAAHPDPVALRAAWERVAEDLEPVKNQSGATDAQKSAI